MRQSLLRDIARRLTGSVAVVFFTMGVLGSSQALAGIASTKHNLGTTGTGTNHLTTGTAEICVFCHTPHGADTSASVPLWNRKLDATPATTYSTYNSLGTSSLDGATAQVGSVSLACLSCHDGTQAMNVMINQPGSGGYNGVAGASATPGDVWTAGNTSGTGQLSGATNITYISTDLKNDHPIGIQYGGGPSGSLPAAGSDYSTFKDPDFKTAKSASLNSQTVWWVETPGSAVGRQKTDIQLYTRTETSYVGGTSTIAASVSQPYVECASCHDPHVDNVAGNNPTFLRISNAGSAVCLTCHNK